MANWDILKSAIANVIKSNGNQEITGTTLQAVLYSIITEVGGNATFAGIATPSTNPGIVQGPVFYFAYQSGTYSNFGYIDLSDDEVAFIYYNGSTWNKLVTGLPKSSKVLALEASTGYTTCSTDAGTSAKAVIKDNFTLTTNCRLLVKMTNANTASGVTLEVNGTGPKLLFYNGSAASINNSWDAGEVLDIYYDGKLYYASNVQGNSGSGGNMILEWDTDAETTRKSVTQKRVKPGMQISYNDPNNGWINEQYIGEDVSSNPSASNFWSNSFWRKIPHLDYILDEENKGFYPNPTEIIYDEETWIDGFISRQGEVTNNNSTYNAKTSPFYKVNQNTFYIVSAVKAPGGVVNFYDSNKKFISYQTVITDYPYINSVTSGTVYIRFCVNTTEVDNFYFKTADKYEYLLDRIPENYIYNPLINGYLPNQRRKTFTYGSLKEVYGALPIKKGDLLYLRPCLLNASSATIEFYNKNFTKVASYTQSTFLEEFGIDLSLPIIQTFYINNDEWAYVIIVDLHTKYSNAALAAFDNRLILNYKFLSIQDNLRLVEATAKEKLNDLYSIIVPILPFYNENYLKLYSTSNSQHINEKGNIEVIIADTANPYIKFDFSRVPESERFFVEFDISVKEATATEISSDSPFIISKYGNSVIKNGTIKIEELNKVTHAEIFCADNANIILPAVISIIEISNITVTYIQKNVDAYTNLANNNIFPSDLRDGQRDFIKNWTNVGKGIKYVAFGDSITAASGDSSYTQKVANFFNFELVNLGWSGATLYQILDDNQLAKLPEGNVEFVTITGGNGSVVNDDNLDSEDRSTVYGAINYAIKLLYSKYPNVKIFMVGVTQRGENCSPSSWNEPYKKIAEHWNIPYIDNEKSCQFNKTNMSIVTTDYTHFTVEGSRRYAAGIIEAFRKNYNLI